ncbi:NADH:ubiquinone oxidoreductase, B subunit [gamma proteobacterium HTCC5015]|nr:NADH:ubiquinone oxidoreductase, B subunit [gamma proteobacterium HTCC5015]
MRKFLDNIAPHFEKGGKYEKFFSVYEMIDTFFWSPPSVTHGQTHVRDAIDLKRVMTYVVIATLPCILMAWFNTGMQANTGMAGVGMDQVNNWRGDLMAMFGIAQGAAAEGNLLANVFHGFLYFVPIYLTTLIVGGIWEVLFASVRGHEVNEGFLVTSMLYTLTMPPDAPLWVVALGISFGVVLGKEVFGGTGKNFLNPALTGRAFLYFAYPAHLSGNSVWTAVDGVTGATPLGLAATGGIQAVEEAGFTLQQSFLGMIPGSLGETSTLACLIGAAFLIFTKIASHRVIFGVFVGMVATTWLFNAIGSDTNPMFAMPWYWHLSVGGFAFGMVYMATDPVSAAMTNKGRWAYGILIGFMCVVIRVANPAFPEGMMLAILFANLWAPIFDNFVVQANIKRRMQRNG